MKFKLIGAVLLCFIAVSYCIPENDVVQVSQKKEVKKMTELKVEDTQVGEGKTAEKGNVLNMHYTGKLEDGTVFDSSHNRGQPLQFTLGIGQVIQGWDEGVAGMKVGGKRTLTIPPHMAYGERGAGGVIPPNSTLIFDIELMDVA